MQTPEAQEAIRGFMTRTFLIDFAKQASPDTDLFDAGLIDSYGFIELVGFIEQTFGVALSDEDLASKDVATLRGLANLVAGRLGKN